MLFLTEEKKPLKWFHFYWRLVGIWKKIELEFLLKGTRCRRPIVWLPCQLDLEYFVCIPCKGGKTLSLQKEHFEYGIKFDLVVRLKFLDSVECEVLL